MQALKETVRAKVVECGLGTRAVQPQLQPSSGPRPETAHAQNTPSGHASALQALQAAL